MADPGPLRWAFVLPGLHRVTRGAETAFESLGEFLGRREDCEVTLFGMGEKRPETAYRFVSIPGRPRERFERWPRFPALRRPEAWEDLAFCRRLRRRYDPAAFDVTVTCSYPWSNWLLRAKKRDGRRPLHLFVTENGDWPATSDDAEFRFFGCDGLVCTNPDYFERNRERWPSSLIPNGVDPDRFHPGPATRAAFDLPAGVPMVLMVSALTESKRVAEGIEAVARLDHAHLAVAGDGPLRERIETLGREKLPGRFHRLLLPRERMPDLYRSADVFLHLSLEEPSANAYVEAMATGLPIVTHDRAVTRWTLENTGLLLDTRDLEEVARTLGQAIEAPERDRTERQRNIVADRLTWSRIAADYLEFIRELAATP